MADVVEVLLRRAELAGADGAAEDDESEEEAEEGDGAVAARALHLADAPDTQAPFQHSELTRFNENELINESMNLLVSVSQMPIRQGTRSIKNE